MNDMIDNANIYEKFDWLALNETHLKEKIVKVVELIPEDTKTIVDVGCGNGVITNVLGQKYEVIGVDRSEYALSMVKTKKVKASSENIPLPGHSFDMVFSSELLEHLEDGVFQNTIQEFERLTKKYILITVPNSENPDKLLIKCPSCQFIYNSPNHLRRFNADDFIKLFPNYRLLKQFSFGKNVRYYNSHLLNIKKIVSPAQSWIPYYWMPENKRKTICPKCEHEFKNRYRFNLFATFIDILNVLISPKKPYWLFVLLEKK